MVEESIELGSSQYKKRFWGYDDNGRLVSHKDDELNETEFTCNARDLCTSETYADTGVKTFGYTWRTTSPIGRTPTARWSR